MTGFQIIKYLGTDTEVRPCEDIAIYEPRRVASEETNPADKWITDFWPPEP